MNPNTLRQGRLHRRRDLFDLALDGNRVPLVAAIDTQGNRRALTDEIAPLPRHTFNAHRRHVPDGQLRPIRVKPKHDPRNLIRGAFFNTSAHPRIGAFHIARRIGINLLRNRLCDLGHADVMRHKVHKGHLDKRLWRGKPPDRRARHAFGKKAHHEFINILPKLLWIDRPGHDHIRDPVPPCSAPHTRLFGLLRQGCYRINRCLHLIRRTRHVPARLELKRNRRPPFGRLRLSAFHPFNA